MDPSAGSAEKPTKCPPNVSVLASGADRFDLPAQCTVSCETGIDSVDATIRCGGTTIKYYSAFDSTVRRGLASSDPGVMGRGQIDGIPLYWGRPVEKPEKVCAVLDVPYGPDRYFHAMCAPYTEVALELILRVLRSHRTSPDDKERRRLCPYCA
jgi:hypothetical protein